MSSETYGLKCAFVGRTRDFLTNSFLLSGCGYGAGDASVYFGAKVDETLVVAEIDGVFPFSASSRFTAEDPSTAVAGPVSGPNGGDTFTVRFLNDNHRKFTSCRGRALHVKTSVEATNQRV